MKLVSAGKGVSLHYGKEWLVNSSRLSLCVTSYDRSRQACHASNCVRLCKGSTSTPSASG